MGAPLPTGGGVASTGASAPSASPVLPPAPGAPSPQLTLAPPERAVRTGAKPGPAAAALERAQKNREDETAFIDGLKASLTSSPAATTASRPGNESLTQLQERILSAGSARSPAATSAAVAQASPQAQASLIAPSNPETVKDSTLMQSIEDATRPQTDGGKEAEDGVQSVLRAGRRTQ